MPNLQNLPTLMNGAGGDVNGVTLVHGAPWDYYVYKVWLDGNDNIWKIQCHTKNGDEVWFHEDEDYDMMLWRAQHHLPEYLTIAPDWSWCVIEDKTEEL